MFFLAINTGSNTDLQTTQISKTLEIGRMNYSISSFSSPDVLHKDREYLVHNTGSGGLYQVRENPENLKMIVYFSSML